MSEQEVWTIETTFVPFDGLDTNGNTVTPSGVYRTSDDGLVILDLRQYETIRALQSDTAAVFRNAEEIRKLAEEARLELQRTMAIHQAQTRLDEVAASVTSEIERINAEIASLFENGNGSVDVDRYMALMTEQAQASKPLTEARAALKLAQEGPQPKNGRAPAGTYGPHLEPDQARLGWIWRFRKSLKGRAGQVYGVHAQTLGIEGDKWYAFQRVAADKPWTFITSVEAHAWSTLGDRFIRVADADASDGTNIGREGDLIADDSLVKELASLV